VDYPESGFELAGLVAGGGEPEDAFESETPGFFSDLFSAFVSALDSDGEAASVFEAGSDAESPAFPFSGFTPFGLA